MKLLNSSLEYVRQLPHRQAWYLAWPMILSNLSVPMMGLADTAMLGHLESPLFLGAVAIGSNIVSVLYWMFSFLRMGTTSVTGQAAGAGDNTSIALHLTQNALLGVGLGILLFALQSFLLPLVVWLIAPDPELESLALAYCQIRLYSAPAILASYAVIGWLLGIKKPKYALAIMLASNILNIVLDYIFIVQWDMNARGAATATLIAEYFACFCAVGCAIKVLQDHHWHPTQWFDWATLKASFTIGADLFLRTIALLFVINFFHAQSAKLGTDILAANALLIQGVLFIAFFLDGYALTGETLTAQAIGKRNEQAFHDASAVTTGTAAIIALGLTALFMVGGNSMISLLTDIEEVKRIANEHLIWLVFMPLISVWCYALDGIFIGAGQTRIMRNTMLASLIFGFLPLWWGSKSLENHGLWLAFFVFNALRGLSLGYAYWHLSTHKRWL